MNKTLKHLLAFVFSIAYILVVYFVAGIFFSTNDDRFMGELLSGSITGNPETHLVYVNYLLSLPLSLLYRVSTHVSWFGLLLIFLHWLSCFAILDSFYVKAKTKWDMLITSALVAVLYLSELYLLSQITYTMTAAFVALSGYVCLLLRENKKERLIWFIILEALAFLLRDKAMLMAQPLGFAVFFGVLLIQKEELKKKLRCFCEVLCILLVIFVVGFLGNKLAYQSEEWNFYNEYNDVRTTLFDYSNFPSYEEVSHILTKYDVSENAYNAYTKYLILDETLRLECAKELAEYIRQTDNESTKNSLSGLLLEYLDVTFENSYWYTNLLPLLGYICIILLFLCSGNYKALIPTGFLFLGRCVIWLYLIFGGRLLNRISMPLFACELLILVTLGFLSFIDKKPLKTFGKLIAICLVFVLCLGCAYSGFLQLKDIRKNNALAKEYVDDYVKVLTYCEKRPENRYILDTISFFAYTGEATDTRFYGNRNCILAGTWFANSLSALSGNEAYLKDTANGFYFILRSTTDNPESDKDEMTHPIVLYFAEMTGCEPVIADTIPISYGEEYSVVYFDGTLNLNQTN